MSYNPLAEYERIEVGDTVLYRYDARVVGQVVEVHGSRITVRWEDEPGKRFEWADDPQAGLVEFEEDLIRMPRQDIL